MVLRLNAVLLAGQLQQARVVWITRIAAVAFPVPVPFSIPDIMMIGVFDAAIR
jgi:hypothetical protein